MSCGQEPSQGDRKPLFAVAPYRLADDQPEGEPDHERRPRVDGHQVTRSMTPKRASSRRTRVIPVITSSPFTLASRRR